MIKEYGSYAYSLGEDIQAAADRTIENYSTGNPAIHKDEDDITSGFLQEIASHIPASDDIPDKFIVSADRVRQHIEVDVGADYAILYDVSSIKYTLQTAILVQAKRRESDYYKKFDKLIGQCERMLSFTTDSFVMDYSLDGMSAVPAVSVAGTDESEFNNDTVLPQKFHSKGPKSLFTELFMGYLGNEHTYNRVHQLTGYGAGFRRQNGFCPDGGDETSERNYIQILSVEVTMEQ